MKEYLAQAGIREAGAMDDVAQAARDAASVLEVRYITPSITRLFYIVKSGTCGEGIRLVTSAGGGGGSEKNGIHDMVFLRLRTCYDFSGSGGASWWRRAGVPAAPRNR